MRFSLVGLSLLVMGGCSTAATLRIYSQPTGAYVSELGTGRVFGITPTVAYYSAESLAGARDASGCYRVHGFEARWVSGARAPSQASLRLCSGPTDTYDLVITRNPSDAGLEKDLQFALQVEAIIAQQRQAEAEQFSAAAALSNAFRGAQQQSTSAINCTSRAAAGGQSIQTSCR